MEKKYQVTLYDKEGRYKPISTIVTFKDGMDRKAVIKKGTEQICNGRRWTKRDILKYGYLMVKIRKVDE